MPATCVRFAEFELDAANRTLRRGVEPVALNARYFDALVLLLREPGRLVAKQRFFDEVWAGSVVTDAALTQCIKEIRRQLGDEAAAPRFVLTVPGHGYRFIAPVDVVEVPGPAAATTDAAPHTAVPEAGRDTAPAGGGRRSGPDWPRLASDIAAISAGGAAAGLFGGLLYGSALAFAAPAQGLGSLSVLLVLVSLSVLVGSLGAFGVAVGLAGGALAGGSRPALLVGGTVGGLAVGGLAKLLGSDTFVLLIGTAPSGITGGLEGGFIGLAVSLGLLLGGDLQTPRLGRAVSIGAATTAIAGALVPLAGGSMMASSLAGVARTFAHSRLDLAALGRLVGQPGLDSGAQAALGAVEGAVFGACVIGLLRLARRQQ